MLCHVQSNDKNATIAILTETLFQFELGFEYRIILCLRTHKTHDHVCGILDHEWMHINTRMHSILIIRPCRHQTAPRLYFNHASIFFFLYPCDLHEIEKKKMFVWHHPSFMLHILEGERPFAGFFVPKKTFVFSPTRCTKYFMYLSWVLFVLCRFLTEKNSNCFLSNL